MELSTSVWNVSTHCTHEVGFLSSHVQNVSIYDQFVNLEFEFGLS